MASEQNDLTGHMADALSKAGLSPGPNPAGQDAPYYPAHTEVVNADSKRRVKGNSGNNLTLNYPWKPAQLL